MSHLETLIAEYLDWQGYLVKRNTKVGRLGHGGWEMELDIIGYQPNTGTLVHYEPSIDALSWAKREARCQNKLRPVAITSSQTSFPGCHRLRRFDKLPFSSVTPRVETQSPAATSFQTTN